MRFDTLRSGMAGHTPIVDAVGYATSCTRSHLVVIRVHEATGKVIETLEHTGEFKKP